MKNQNKSDVFRRGSSVPVTFVCFLILTGFSNVSVAQQTSAPPTRAEILKGALTPERTCYDVTSYNLDVRIDPATKSINGSNKITFKTVNDFTRMQVDLWSNLPISRITFDEGRDASFTRELNAVFVELPEPVRKDSVHSVTVFYSGQPVIAKRAPWDGGFTWDHDDEGNPWVVVTCPETGASIWWPNKDHASDEPDTMNISITVPAGLEEISNGRFKSKTILPDGWVRYEWFVSYPINNYCVTFNIGKYAHFSDEYVSADGENLTMDYYVLPKNLEKAKEQFKQAKTMIGIFEKYFGKYPFYRDGYKLVECPHTGMEHQTCVAYGNHYLGGYRGRASSEVGLKFDFIIIHESAHEWWGNSVTMKDIADMWIHESFGAYAESLFVEDQYGHDQAIKYINGKKGNVRNDRPIIAEYDRYQKSASDMYDKGQLILNTLRSVLDDDALWISIMRGLQEKFRCQNVSADEVFAFINGKTGRDLSYFFNQYFRHANIPTLVVQTVKEGDAVTARYRWEAAVSDFRMPIKVTTAPGKFEFVTATTDWQTKKLNGIAPEDFKVAEDLFYVNTRLRWSYLDPRRAVADVFSATTVAKPRIEIETEVGNILAELDADAAPVTVSNFLRYAENRFYDGGTFFRTATSSNQPTNNVKIEVIQAEAAPVREAESYPPIPLERTRDTGLRHRDGTLSMARDGPDTAQSSFSICVGDQPELDFGGKRNPDGQGFAAFGHVIKGMEVARKIHDSPSNGQRLTQPVHIMRIVRVR
jgi:aminopeptidase N/cyclophilin family peptidyl-prolyl cis-trans isomerase